MISAGFDAHADDPLGGMRLSAGQFVRLTEGIVRIADASARRSRGRAGRRRLRPQGAGRLHACRRPHARRRGSRGPAARRRRRARRRHLRRRRARAARVLAAIIGWGPGRLKAAPQAAPTLIPAPHVRLSPAGTRREVAGPLAARPRVRSGRRSVAPEVLLPRDVRVSVGARPRGPRAQLHHRRRDGTHQADARLQRAASVRLGRLRPAGRERRDQGRHPPRDVHPRQHRAHEGPAAAARHQLRLGARAGHVRRRVLQVEPVALHPDVREGAGLPAEVLRELVPGGPHGAGERAGRGRRLLALRDTGRDARPGAVVLPHHRLRRRTARRRRRPRPSGPRRC